MFYDILDTSLINIVKALRNTFTFNRASRSEYWYFSIFMSVFLAILWPLFSSMIYIFKAPYYDFLTFIAAIITTFAVFIIFSLYTVTSRRLHDINHSAWWFFINVVPVVGTIYFIILMMVDSNEGFNQYGAHPNRSLEDSAALKARNDLEEYLDIREVLNR